MNSFRKKQTEQSIAATTTGKSLQSCLTIDGSPPCFPVPGILQARTLEWVAISMGHLKKQEGPQSMGLSVFTGLGNFIS